MLYNLRTGTVLVPGDPTGTALQLRVRYHDCTEHRRKRFYSTTVCVGTCLSMQHHDMTLNIEISINPAVCQHTQDTYSVAVSAFLTLPRSEINLKEQND